MKRNFRLRKKTDFQRVRRLGRSKAHPLVVLVKLENESGRTRFGVTASRAVGGAVQRNRAKRRIQGILNPIASQVAGGWDLIFIARRPLMNANHAELQHAVFSLLKKSGLFQDPAK